ncbi:hypothetical protein [Streptomyces sp. NPDC015131]|uniref:hypothetical protein n=1 Tax=Streptomyces sp. NPDC015131 TaxID=3364941 RepID=UPI0036FD9690
MSAGLLTGAPWVVVRQHRRALWTALGLLAAAIAVMLGSRLWADHAEEALRAVDCTLASGDPRCFQPGQDYIDAIWLARHLVEYTAVGITVLPALAGAFVAGPMIARELEAGTYGLVWTQSVSPTRWLAAKLAVPLAVTVSGAALLALMFHWAWSTGPAHDFPTYWYAPTMYASMGVVPAASAVLGIALGTLAGLLVRRTVAAMAVTAAVMGALALLLSQVRAHLWPVRTFTGTTTPPFRDSMTWTVERGMLTPSGARLNMDTCFQAPGARPALCDTRSGVTYYLDHHPASHFWPLQLVESAIVLGLAAIAVVLALRALRRHHA